MINIATFNNKILTDSQMVDEASNANISTEGEKRIVMVGEDGELYFENENVNGNHDGVIDDILLRYDFF